MHQAERCVVQMVQVMVAYTAQKVAMRLEVELLDQLGHIFAEPAGCAGQDQRRRQLVFVAQPAIGSQQARHILARLDGADKQDEVFRDIEQRLDRLQRDRSV